jgi:hypothetical protein
MTGGVADGVMFGTGVGAGEAVVCTVHVEQLVKK